TGVYYAWALACAKTSEDRGALDAEVAHHILELLGKACQLAAGPCGLFRPLGGLLGHLTDGGNVAVHFRGDGTLLFRGAGDTRVHVLERRHGTRNRRERIAGMLGLVHHLAGPAAASVHDLHGLARSKLQALDHGIDFLSGLLSAHSE